MSDSIRIEIKNLKEVQRALAEFPRQSSKYLSAAGREAAKKIIFSTEGLKKYPPLSDANLPPPPLYRRGHGMINAKGELTGVSERMGTQFFAEKSGEANTLIGNRASYAPFVVGEDQAHFMAPKGWRKLREVVEEKLPEITDVYNKWVAKLLEKINLK